MLNLRNLGPIDLSLKHDLMGDGPSANLDEFPNAPITLRRFQRALFATTSSTNVTIESMLDDPALGSYTIDLYTVQSCNPSGSGQGAAYLGTTRASLASLRRYSFSFPKQAAHTTIHVALTSTEPDGSKSEFSHCVTAAIPC